MSPPDGLPDPRPAPPPQRAGPAPTTSPAPRKDPQEAFNELGQIILGEEPLGQVLRRVADLAAATVPGAEHVSVTLIEGESARSAAFTSAIAATMDERQYESGFGPCMDAAISGGTVQIRDMATDTTYPAFAALAVRQGVTGSLSVGMPVPRRTVGGLNMYRTSAAPFGEHAPELATVFAGYAGIALANASLYASTAELAEQMQRAMESRAMIEQAKGVLMAQLGVSAEAAFKHLAKLSQDRNVKLRDLAGRIVAETARGGDGTQG